MTVEDLKDTATETPTGETQAEQGTVAEVKEETAHIAETTPTEEMVSKKELDKLRNQAKMRENQLENELRQARESAQSAGNDELVDTLSNRLSELEAERESEAQAAKLKEYESTLDTVFDKTLESYPEQVQKAAKFIRSKSGIQTIVGDASFTFEAEKNIKEFLEGLNNEVVVEKPEIKVEAQNLPYTPEVKGKIEIEEGAPNMGAGEEDYLSKIAKDSFKSIGIEI